jgi:hypothetical protein
VNNFADADANLSEDKLMRTTSFGSHHEKEEFATISFPDDLHKFHHLQKR